MALLSLYAGEDQLVPTGSGLGFYGDGFGLPVLVGDYQNRTFVTDASGSVSHYEANNTVLYSGGGVWGSGSSVSGVIHGQAGSGISLLNLPNRLATINVRFTHSVPVRTQSAALYLYDGTDTAGVPNKQNSPSGLTAWAAEIIHPSDDQTVQGSGDSVWQLVMGSGSLGLISTPGTSGLRPSGDLTLDVRHDFFAAISATPTIPGDKTFSILSELEFV